MDPQALQPVVVLVVRLRVRRGVDLVLPALHVVTVAASVVKHITRKAPRTRLVHLQMIVKGVAWVVPFAADPEVWRVNIPGVQPQTEPTLGPPLPVMHLLVLREVYLAVRSAANPEVPLKAGVGLLHQH